MPAERTVAREEIAMPGDEPRFLARCWRRVAPAGVARRMRWWRHGPRFSGHFSRWNEAVSRCRGYDDAETIDRVVAAARAVREGKAAWERDGTFFARPAVNQPLLDALLDIGRSEQGALDIVDFGGAMGSAWWQHRGALRAIEIRRWAVVEQPVLVARGRAEFDLPPLCFFPSLDEACSEGGGGTLLLSSVLQYLPDPMALLRDAKGRGFRHIILDRTSFGPGPGHRLTVQSNGSVLRPVRAYPCWFFEEGRFFSQFLPEYTIERKWDGFDSANIPGTRFGGCWLTRMET